MARAVEVDKASYPAAMNLLGANTVVFDPVPLAEPLDHRGTRHVSRHWAACDAFRIGPPHLHTRKGRNLE